MSWPNRVVLLKAGPGRWLVRDRAALGGDSEADLAVIEMTHNGFVVLMATPAWSGVAEVPSLREARAFVAVVLGYRANMPR